MKPEKTLPSYWGTRIYWNWRNMRSRCENPNNPRYKDYGARGITVCERWHSFENYWADMGPTYKEGLQIDRINNDLGYSKENCRWVPRKINMRNRRNTVWVETDLFGIVPLGELAEVTQIPYNTLWGRVNRGDPVLTEFEVVKFRQEDLKDGQKSFVRGH